jgi:tetratricopeptide (TPR) repeat protein
MRGALKEADLAAAELWGLDAAALQMQRAVILGLFGRGDEALGGYRRALAAFRRYGDKLWMARCHNNRGHLLLSRWELSSAEADFERAIRPFGELGQELGVADVQWNLGIVAARKGDIPGALAAFDRTDHYYRRNDINRAFLLVDRCEVLLSARLVDEALASAEQAVEELSGSTRDLGLAEARLSLAHAALLGGDGDRAADSADRARRAFAETAPPWMGGPR